MEVGMWERARDNDVLFSVTGLSVVPRPVHIVVIVIQTTGTDAPAFTRCTNPSTFDDAGASAAARYETRASLRPKKVASIGEGKQASIITGARQAEDLYARHTPPPLHLDHGSSATTVKHSRCRPKPPAESLPTLQKSPRPRPRQRPPPSSTPSLQPPHHRHKLHHRRRGHSPPRRNLPRLLVRSDHSSLTLRARPSQRAQPSMRHPSGPRRPIRPQRLAVSPAAGRGAGDAAI